MDDFIGTCDAWLIDGQKLYFCPPEKWSEYLESGTVDGVPIPDFSCRRIKAIVLPLSVKYQDLHLGMIVERFEDRARFSFYTIVDIEEHQQRVEIVPITCGICNWSGYFGNPLVSDIYFGISKEYKPHELMRKTRYFDKKPCPSCGAEFNRSAIWVGELH